MMFYPIDRPSDLMQAPAVRKTPLGLIAKAVEY
jgi:hypothetical protein